MEFHEIINYYIGKYNYKNYLQIGLYDLEDNFLRIQCETKNSIDPHFKSAFRASSENYFRHRKFFDSIEKYDLIFINSVYFKNQFLNDVYNCLSILSDNGCIICKGCDPRKVDDTQQINMHKRSFCGDAYLGWLYLRYSRSDLKMGVFPAQDSIGVIKRGSQVPFNSVVDDYFKFVATRYHSLPIITKEDLENF